MVERSAVDGFATHAFPVIFVAVFALGSLAGIGAWLRESSLLAVLVVFIMLVLIGYLAVIWRQSQSLNQISAVLDQDGSRYRDIASGQELNAGAIRHLKHYALESERSHKHQHERLAEFLHMASELATSAEHSALNADQQKQAIACSAAAVTELSQSIRDVASQVNDAHKRIESSRQETSESMHIAKSTREDIHGTTQLADQTAQLVSELTVQSNNVVTMSSIIQDIADQTNLLSLNAAIEAARAGEQGMGFAVVADEVRKLSHRSRDSAEEISTSIAQVQKQMNLIKEQVDDVVEKAHLNVGSINAMEERLSCADAGMASMTEKMYVISTAAEQQSLATDEISRNIEAILSQAEQNSALSSETVSISKYLADKAQQSQKEAAQL